MLIDTSGLLALIHLGEPQHEAAKQFYRNAHKCMVQNYVLDEFVALSHRRGVPRGAQLAFSESILVDRKVDVVWVDESLHRAGLNLLQARLDKTYSLCDAVSFVIMRERGIREALTTDKHFEQEGFRRLLTS